MAGVSVWEVVEARAGPLTEHETWALLAAAATTAQDNVLSGEGRVDVATPEGVVLQRCGRVDLVATPPNSPAHPHGNYLPPEAFTDHQTQEVERLLVFSLGRTLWTVASHGAITSGSGGPNGILQGATTTTKPKLSSSLRSTLSAMTHTLQEHRLTLVDIFQLLVERLNSRDRINYTAIIRSLYEEVLGPPRPPLQPPDPVVARCRSYSALETTRPSTGRRPTSLSLSLSQHSTSMEDLRSHRFSPGSNNPASITRTQSTNNYSTPRRRGVTGTSSINDSTLRISSFRTSTRLADDLFNENPQKNLLTSKRNYHSMDTISSAKENIMPRSIGGSEISSMGGTMNPILEVSSAQSSPTKTPPENDSENAFPYKESRTTVTVSRSATVAGTMKTQVLEVHKEGLSKQKKIPPKKPPRSRAMSVDNLLNTETELRQNFCEFVPKKRRMVVRTPSRLYHFAESSASCIVGHVNTKVIPPILGPEFVVRSKEPAKVLNLLQDTQRGTVKKVTVILVTGRKLELTCDPAVARVSHILQAVFQEEKLPLQHLLGLAVLGSGEFHFVAPQTKLHKVSPPGWKERQPTKDGLIQNNFTLHLRFIYYVRFNNVDEMESMARQLLYLQLRHDVLEGRLPVPPDALLHLATLALQAEFGDKKEQDVSYFLAEHYVPESLLRGGQVMAVSQQLHQNHAALAGLHYTQAQVRFITSLQDTQHYGTHYYHVTQDKGRQQCWLGIGREGILVLGSGPLTSEAVARATFHSWPSVKRVSYTTHRLTIAIRGSDKSTKIKLNLQENRSRYVFYLTTVHQGFHRDAATLNQLSLSAGGSGLPVELVSSQQDFHSQATSSASSATTTARTSLSSAGTADDVSYGGHLTETPGSLGNIQGAEDEHKDVPNTFAGFGREKNSEATSLWPIVLGGQKSSNSLSRDNFLSEILWRSGGEETDEVFSIENLENEQQFHRQEENTEASAVKTLVPRVFHQRSKSNIESSSTEGSGGIRPELTREFVSDESLLASPKKGHAVRMGTRVSAAALQKRRLRSAEALQQQQQQHQQQFHHLHLQHLPSLHELNTSSAAVVVEPSLRSVVVEEEDCVSDSLLERFLQCPSGGGQGCERRLRSITLTKEEGSLGVMIAEGADHGLYIQGVSPGGPAALEGSLQPGDRVVGINGRSVENLSYTAAVDLLRHISHQVTLLVSQPAGPPTPSQPAGPPTTPSQPAGPPTTPSQPAGPPTTPSQPAGPPTTPSQPAGPPTTPSQPAGPPTTPSQPAGPPTTPSHRKSPRLASPRIRTTVSTRQTQETPLTSTMPTAREDASRLPTAREDASRLPTAREDASRLPTAREDASRLPTAREDASRLPTAREDASRLPTAREDASRLPTPREDASRLPTAREDASRLPIAREDVSRLPTAREDASRLPTATAAPDNTSRQASSSGEIGQATIRAVGGVVTFAREVRSGPVTVITINASSPPHHPGPSDGDDDSTIVSASGVITLGPRLPPVPSTAPATSGVSSAPATSSRNLKL
ncbi:tyrosine-protein phosphatase non-receptor type 13 isoform X2 [Procambarus clarkii]|uniref:tyrosine-protein phosphatase non-receptor type 13 isoform X2 n=1 Tax=Procambarus clarkii TaxID=6728 RepID=UPI00374389FE